MEQRQLRGTLVCSLGLLLLLLSAVSLVGASDQDSWREDTNEKIGVEPAAPDAWGDSDDSSLEGSSSEDENGAERALATEKLIDAVRRCDSVPVAGKPSASGLADQVSELLKGGADAKASVETAGKREWNLGVLRVGPKKPTQVQSVLSLAVSKCCPAIVRALLEHGASRLGRQEAASLVSATARGRRQILCSHTLDALDPKYESNRESVRAAMAIDQERRLRAEELARMLPHADAAELSKLFEEGLDPDMEVGGAPLLHIARTAKRAEAILAAGADVTKKDRAGASALQNAIRSGVPVGGDAHRGLIRVLLSSKAGRAMVHVDRTMRLGDPFTLAVRKCDAAAVTEIIDAKAVLGPIGTDLIARLEREVQNWRQQGYPARTSLRSDVHEAERHQACADTLSALTQWLSLDDRGSIRHG